MLRWSGLRPEKVPCALAERGMMTREQPSPVVYRLRLWRVVSGGRPIWHASLEHPRTAECRGFADLHLLLAFLEDETTELERADSPGCPANLPPGCSAC